MKYPKARTTELTDGFWYLREISFDTGCEGEQFRKSLGRSNHQVGKRHDA